MLIPRGLGQMRGGLQLGHEAEPPLLTTSGQGCRQGKFAYLEERRALISDAFERLFENLAWKYRWG